jgi:hypothetical protein
LDAMVREGIVRPVSLAGRKSKDKRTPESFYALYGTDYNKIVGRIQEKREVSRDLNAQLTGHAIAGIHAENLFEKAFYELGFKIHGRDVDEFRGLKVNALFTDRQPPNLDFVIEKDSVVYGVDIKNWIKYESDSRQKVIRKVQCAIDLNIIPFIIARYVDKDTMYTEVIVRNGLCYPYRTLLLPPSQEVLADKADNLLGYPILAVDTLPVYKVKWIDLLHKRFIEKNLK